MSLIPPQNSGFIDHIGFRRLRDEIRRTFEAYAAGRIDQLKRGPKVQ